MDLLGFDFPTAYFRCKQIERGATMKVTLKIREDRKDEFIARVQRINKKAAKLALPPLSLIFTEREIIPDRKADPTGERCIVLVLLPVLIEGEEPMLAGWRFVAAIDHVTAEANIIRCRPGCELNAKWRSATPDCQHCGTTRNRLKTYVLEHESGEVKQVGSTCIGDFLGDHGTNPEGLAAYEEELFALSAESWSEEGEGGASGSNLLDTTHLLEAAAAHIRLYGWTSRSAAKMDLTGQTIPTANLVQGWLLFQSRYATRELKERWEEARPTDADKEKAEKAREWARRLNPVSDYEHNLKTIASLEVIGLKHLGIAVSLINAYDRAIGEEIRRNRAAIVSEHFGEVKVRGNWGAIVTRVNTIEGQYGTTWIVGFSVGAGNEAVWFASKNPDVSVGDAVVLAGSVKKHDTYKGVKQTTLTRCKLSKVE